MPDLSLNVRGKDDGASSVLKGVAGSVTAAGAAFAAFTVSSVRAAEEGARADRILERAAGDLADAFKEQASAMQSSLGVSDDMVKQMQSVLLTFGQAPADVEKTTRALLDYAAFTGEDALSATKKLTSSIETGKQAFKEYGVQYDVTGSKSKDLVAAVDALRLKFGGTAEADANSLTGTINKSKEAFGDLEKTWGGLVASFVVKTEAVDNITFALGLLTKAINGPGDKERVDELNDKIRTTNDWLKTYKYVENSADQVHREKYAARKKELAEYWAELDKLEARAAKVAKPLPTSPLGGGDDLTKKGREDQKKAREDLAKDYDEALTKQERRAKEDFQNARELEAHAADAQARALKESSDAMWSAVDEQEKAVIEETKLQQEGMKHELDEAKKHQDKLTALAKEANDKRATELKHQEQVFAQAGAAIGAALINSMASAMESALAGEEQDPTEVFGDVLASILGITGAAVGTAFGGPAGTAIGGAAGGLAGAAVRGLTRRRHDGGWVDAPRYHGGAWVGTDEQPAILQSGERVLSRADVASMGGPRGVDSAVRNGRGGGVNVYVSTIDGSTTADFFARNGVAAMLKNTRLNRGPAFGGAL